MSSQFVCSECASTLPLKKRFERRHLCKQCAAATGIIHSFKQQQRAAHERSIEKQRASQRKRWLPEIAISKDSWIAVPAGTFVMGSPEAEAGRQDNEFQVAVSLSSFEIMNTPVTFAMYDVFCKATKREFVEDHRQWGRETHPVICVSFWDACEYAQWLSLITGWNVRLPTEAEWEYSCRAGTESPYYSGDSIDLDQANFSPYPPSEDARKKTSNVQDYPPNPWGIYDMQGNVREWCISKYRERYEENESLELSNDSSPHSVRGGGWKDGKEELRSARRRPCSPYEVDIDLGFRLVREENNEF